MPARKLILLFLALAIASGTVMLARSMMHPQVGSNAPAVVPPTLDEVLVAAQDLPVGTLIKESDLKWQAWPTGTDTENFAVKGKASASDYVGAVVRQGMRLGEPVMKGRIVRAREQGFMAAVLEPGKRAISVPVTPSGGVAGFVFPGDHVDVIVTHQVVRKTDPDPSGHKVSETVLSNARVLALDQRASDQQSEPKVAQIATLEVTPKQAEMLALVTQIGTIALVLRSLGDPDEQPAINETALANMGVTQNSTQTSASASASASDQPSAQNPAQASPDKAAQGPTMTWDSDISGVLPHPGNRRGVVQRVQIMRGKDTTESLFDLQQ